MRRRRVESMEARSGDKTSSGAGRAAVAVVEVALRPRRLCSSRWVSMERWPGAPTGSEAARSGSTGDGGDAKSCTRV